MASSVSRSGTAFRSGHQTGCNWQILCQDRIDILRLACFLDDRAEQNLQVLQPVLADEIGQGQASMSREISLGSLELQVVDRQDNHGKPLLGRFEALQTEIA